MRLSYGMKTPRRKIELHKINKITNTGFQATWLKNPDGYTQGPRWSLAACGKGCRRSPGCDICMAIAEQLFAEQNGIPLKPVAPRPENLFHPLRWKKRKNAFVCPEGDLLHKNIPDDFVRDVFGVIRETPQHHYVMTTKWPEHLCLLKEFEDITNAFVGVSIESQEYMYRADALLELPNNFYKILFLAPMITPMDLAKRVLAGVDWFIISPERGGEGRAPRPCPEEWLVDLIKQIRAFDHNIPIFLDVPFVKERVDRMGGKFMEVPSALME